MKTIDDRLQSVYQDGHRDGALTKVSADGTSSVQIYVTPQLIAKQAIKADILEIIGNDVPMPKKVGDSPLNDVAEAIVLSLNLPKQQIRTKLEEYFK